MPTQLQAQHLIDNTTSTWTTINGVNGRKITSKTDSSKYIFIPAGGAYENTTISRPGTYGHCYTTKWYYDKAHSLFFDRNVVQTITGSRYTGKSVRAIK